MSEEPPGADERWGWFEVERLEPRSKRLRQGGMFLTGLIGLWAAHDIARWPADPSSTQARAWSATVTAFALSMVVSSTGSFIDSVDHGQARVFRWRHFLLCSMVLVAAAIAVSLALVARSPFSRLLAHGSITGPDFVDLGHVIAAGLCLVAAIRGLIACCEAFGDERSWHRRF